MTGPVKAAHDAYLDAQAEYHELRERLGNEIAAANRRADVAYRRWERLRDAARDRPDQQQQAPGVDQ
jgi:hypothetical protein